MAIDGTREYSLVQDAAVGQKEKKLSLVIVVSFAASEEYSKELGDNFVRMVKTFGPGPSPSKEIGTGVFDFLITVVYPDETIVAQGAKVSSSPHITW